jgi:hypothetical protein
LDLATIDVATGEAEAKLAEYQRVVAGERNAEDAALAQAYRAVRRGLPVIHLPDVIQAGGYFPNGLPRLAVVRADATECFVSVERWHSPGQTMVFGVDRRRDNRGAAVGRATVRVNTPSPFIDASARPASSGRTIVPLIPPRYRPGRPRLSSCHVLWEVEAWDATPPRDPALLHHIRGDLWTVLAVWDLTELERAVLSARA